MYAMVCTRPNLADDVSQVCKSMCNPGMRHWEAMKGTIGRGIMFGSQQGDPLVIRYVDYDYVGDLDDKKSTIGYVFTLASGPVYWKFIIQSLVAMSTIEVEYMSVVEASKEVVWLVELVKELGIE